MELKQKRKTLFRTTLIRVKIIKIEKSNSTVLKQKIGEFLYFKRNSWNPIKDIKKMVGQSN